jgi:hypothetical protein
LQDSASNTRIRFILYALAIEEKFSQLASGALFEIKNTIEVGVKLQDESYRLAMLEVNGSGALLNDCKIIQLPADYEVVGVIPKVKYKPSNLNSDGKIAVNSDILSRYSEEMEM